MDIILYNKVVPFPELNSLRALKNFVTPVEIEQEEAQELRAFLFALSSINFPIIAHVSIERNTNGEKVGVLITSKQKDQQGSYVVVWGTNIKLSPEGNEYVESFKLDFDVTKMTDNNPKDFLIKRKNTKEWSEHFICLFSRILHEQAMIIIGARKIVNCLVAPSSTPK